MSFKRDESDPGPLGALQRRRVAELLASAIPEDEALLLRDGRLACSLCPHRPVCDTLETLLLHRAGRKHLDSLQRSYGRSRSPQVGPQGPQVTPPGVASEVQPPLLARTRRIARSALLRSAPYSPCCRKKGSSSRLESIPKNPQNPQIPEIPGPAHTEGAAEERKRGRKGKSQISKGNSQISRGNSRISKGNSRISQGNSRISKGNSRISKGNSRISKGNSRISKGNSQISRGNSRISKGNSQISQGNSRISKGNSRISKGNSQISEAGPSPERLRILRHHLHLRSQGWLQDPSGNWVKDGNVEFDSDEEEPPPLPPA